MAEYRIRILTPESAEALYLRLDAAEELINDAIEAYLTENPPESSGGDPDAVKLTGDQTVAGTKTFSSAPVVPANSFAMDRVQGLNAALNARASLIDGKVDPAQLPSLAISEIFTVADEASMLSVTAQRGDMVIREDTGETFVLSSDNPGTLGDWKQIVSPVLVQSVNGEIGDVEITAASLGLGNVDDTSDADKPVSTAQQTALNLKANDAVVVKLSGDQTVAGVKTFSSAPQVPTAAPGTNTAAAASTAYVQAALAALLASAPSTLDTLNELATALGNDPNFATTVTNLIAAKANDADVVKLAGTQTISGTKTFSTAPSVPDNAFGGTKVAASTTSARGTVELATSAETQAGSDGTRAVTPQGLGELPVATAEDLPYDEDRTVAEVLADLLSRVDAIEGAGIRITNSVKPVISGTQQVGQVLSTTNGTWSQTPDSYTYQWRRSGSAISGATSSTYTLQVADIGSNTISVTVTAIKSGFSDGTSTSDPVSITAAPLPFGVSFITPIEKIYSGNTLTFDKADVSTLVAGTKLYVLLYANLNSGASDWGAVGGSGTWTKVGPTWPGASATNRVLTVLEHTVTDPSTEPTSWQFTRTGVNGRNAGALVVAQSAVLDTFVSDYTGTSITNGRQTASLTASANDSIQIFLATKEGTSTSAQNPTTTPSGFTNRVNEAVNDGSGTSAQSFFFVYSRTVAAGATGTSDIAWSAGATNPLAQSFILKAA